jgi:dGTPase
MLFTREDLEKKEEQTLAPYAWTSRASRGREHPEHEAAHRTCFQRDRDRILHTTAFRRLEWKTQVFITYEGDYYRTRLTHTLEVSQIGQSLAKALGANADLVEAICLAHDLGHPPFGHSGEGVLDRLMADHGGFDHNRQSFRIVTILEKRYSGFPGLNLTLETLEGIQKHETLYDKPDPSGNASILRGSLEAQLANAADELAYTAHDLDDGLRSGILTNNDLADLEIWKILQTHHGEGDGISEELIRHERIRDFLGMTIEDLLQATHHRLRERSIRSREQVQKQSKDVVGSSEHLEPVIAALRERLRDQLYRHHRVMRMALKAERFLVDLFRSYSEKPEILPSNVLERAREEDIHRVICDYIAGMTDRFALQEHEKLFNTQTHP